MTSTIPDGAKYEAEIAGGVCLVDVSALLRQHLKKRYRARKKLLTTLFVHHSGADNGKDGIEAIKPMANWHVGHNNWPAIGYQFVITRRPAFVDKSLVIFRVGGSDTVRAHTRMCNRFGDGLCLQGHLGKEPLTSFQEECLEAFLPWWMETHGRNPAKDLGWHSNSLKWGGVPKMACPGKNAVAWLRTYSLLSDRKTVLAVHPSDVGK